MRIARTTDLETCRALRRKVFIEEQGVAEADEIDDLDGEAIHLLAVVNDRPIGTARLLVRGDLGKIGRVCVLADCRGSGVGAELIRASVAELRAIPAIRQVKLSAQTHAIGFYEKLGFLASGGEYMDAGIPHRDMVLET